MTPQERERLDFLCQQVAVERDPKKFSELVGELNHLLEQKEKRLEQESPSR